MRRALHDRLALGGGGVAGADRGADARHRAAAQRAVLRPLPGQLGDLAQRLFEVALDVVAQRLERGDVDDPRLGRQLARLLAEPHQIVDRGEKRGQGLAGAGRRGEQGVAARADRRPARKLGVGGAVEARVEPVPHEGVEVGQHVGRGVGVGCGGGHTF